MDFELKTLNLARLCREKSDALVCLVPLDFEAGADPLSELVALALQAGDFEAKVGKVLVAYRVPGISAKRVVLVGVGDAQVKNIRTALGAGATSLKASASAHWLVSLAGIKQLDDAGVCMAVTALSDAAYAFQTTKSKKPSGAALQKITLGVPQASAVQGGFDKGQALVKGIELAKEWGNRPANYATPTLLAGAAKELAKLKNIHVDVLGPKEVDKLAMGAFTAVAQASAEPLRFIVLRYEGAVKTQAPVVLVGKGITFDTGGISMKPAAEMDEMKFDMCGAASVLGTFRSLAELQPNINVVGLIPACENMPGSRAIKPGDVVTSMSGQTIEILNTDAEGRLVLCDALTYAERFKPAAVVDIATLTGACVIALGGVRSGLFSSDDALAEALASAGDSAQDLCWRMPLDDEYADGLKTNFADVANVAGRAGGSITAAKFLQRFTASFPWAHLDIAGTAWKSGAAKGSTGRPVALLVEYLLQTASTAQVAKKVTAKVAPSKRDTGTAKADKPKSPSAKKPSNATPLVKASAARSDKRSVASRAKSRT